MSLKEIRDRISSISNLKHITEVIERISIIKLKSKIIYLNKFHNYLNELEKLLKITLNEFSILQPRELKKFLNTHPLLNTKNKSSSLGLFFSSNRGLCGSYNQNIASTITDYYIKKTKSKKKIFLYGIGKKAILKLKKLNISAKLFHNINDKSDFFDDSFNKLISSILSLFENNKIGECTVFYTDNKLGNKLIEKKILPFPIKSYISNNTINSDKKNVIYHIDNKINVILDTFIRELFKAKLYYFFTKSIISENLIRNLTSKQATEKSGEILSELKVKYNRERQNKITQELNEIISSFKSILN